MFMQSKPSNVLHHERKYMEEEVFVIVSLQQI